MVVLAHGFQGNSYDLRLIKNHIAMMFPHTQFLCSESNEQHTDGDIEEMGIRLASEVDKYVQESLNLN